MEQIMQELTALGARVGRLEQDNAQLKTENAALQAENDRLEATSEYLKDNATATRKQLAQDGAQGRRGRAHHQGRRVGVAHQLEGGRALPPRVRGPGGGAATDQTRQRIRARLAMTAKINDTLTGTIGLATNGGTNDPRSTNQTLGEGWTRKGIALDLAYVDWKPVESFGMSFGKMPQPWYKVSGYFFDNDINPEGIAARYTAPGRSSPTRTACGSRSAARASDATLFGGQLGLAGQIGGMKLTGALGYFDVGSVQGEITTLSTSTRCTNNTAFFGGAAGQHHDDWTALGCRGARQRLQHGRGARAGRDDDRRPAAADLGPVHPEQRSGRPRHRLARGLQLGQGQQPADAGSSATPTASIEKDAQFGQFVDSDFGGGVTDVDGSIFKLGYAPAKNWVLNGTYFMNNRFVDAPGATERNYDRYQIDINWKF